MRKKMWSARFKFVEKTLNEPEPENLKNHCGTNLRLHIFFFKLFFHAGEGRERKE